MGNVDSVKPVNHRAFKITVVVAAFLSMVFLDQTGVAVTLPTVQKELLLSGAALAWIMNAYMLALSVFLLLFARLSDSLGVKKLFCIGITIFMLASIGCATGHSAVWLITNRALQGVGASLGYATYLLILNHEVPVKDRGKVLGTSAAFAALFLALGPLIGGFFSDVLSWRYLFWLNVPICLIGLYIAMTTCSHSVKQCKRLLPDKGGLLLYMMAIVGIILLLMEAPTWGWTHLPVVVLLIGSLLLFALFVGYEKRHREPLIEIALFKNKVFSSSVLILFGNYACVTTIVFWALWMQQVLGYSPLMAGLALLPAGVPYIFTSRMAVFLYDRHGARLPLFIGSLLFLVGMVEMAVVAMTLQYLWFMLGMFLMGLGWGFVRPTAILTALNSVPASQKSMATGMISTFRQFGAAFGFALVFAVITTWKHLRLTHFIRQQQLHTTVAQLTHAHHLVYPVKMIYTESLSLGLGVISLLALLNLVLVVRYMGHRSS